MARDKQRRKRSNWATCSQANFGKSFQLARKPNHRRLFLISPSKRGRYLNGSNGADFIKIFIFDLVANSPELANFHSRKASTAKEGDTPKENPNFKKR